jgi:hypothetical protein
VDGGYFAASPGRALLSLVLMLNEQDFNAA